MPVQSKFITGRSRRPPPIPAPKPILKKVINAWESPTQSYLGFTPTEPPTPLTPSSPAIQVAVLRSPVTNGPVSPGVSHVTDHTDHKQSDKHSARIKQNGVIVNTNYNVQNGDDGWSSSDDGDERTGSKVNLGILKGARERLRPIMLRQISGTDALRECEDHTDWANDVLKQNNLPLITDLRKSIGDGYTLPTILEIISGSKLTCIKTRPQTKEDRIYNLLNCLKFLCKQGVDISDIDPRDLENGNLKESLQLVGNIRKQFKRSDAPLQNGHVEDGETLSEVSSAPTLPPRNMPGAMKLPGAVPTPFVNNNSSRDPSPRNRINQPGSPLRKSAQEELLPGVVGNRETKNDNKNIHSALISTTQLGTNGVSQHGVEERRQHMESTGNGRANRGILVRHPNGKTTPPGPQIEGQAPHQVTRAWTNSPRLQQRTNNVPVNGKVNENSVEDRLKQLFKSSNPPRPASNQVYHGGGMMYHGGSNYQSGDMFHGGGSEVFDDGEILVVPPPKSRNSPNFDITAVGNHSYGPGYRLQGNQVSQSRGYVPSKPTEKQTGSRGEVLFNTNSSGNNPTIAVRHPCQQFMSQNAPGMTGQGTGGHENNAFSNDEHAGNQAFKGHNSQHGDNLNRPPSGQKTTSNDLRDAWKKLYGRQTPTQGQPITRGDNLRSSYGPQSPSHRQLNNGQYSVKFAPSPTPQASRPVSAPAPAHMQAYFHKQDQMSGQSASQDNLMNNGQVNSTSTQRESPMGQSSSQGPLEESSSSQQSRLSQGQGHPSLQAPFVNVGKLNNVSGSLSSPNSDPASPNYEIGPSSKYPEMGSRPSSAKKQQAVNFHQMSPRVDLQKNIPNNDISRQNFNKPPVNSETHVNIRGKPPINITDNLSSSLQNASKIQHQRGYSYDGSHDNLFNRSHDRSHDKLHNKSHDSLLDRSYSRDMNNDIAGQSIFDFEEMRSETSGSVTPPLPPLSPTNTPPDSPSLMGSPTLPRSASATNVSSTLQGQDLVDSVMKPNMDNRKPRRTSELQFSMDRRRRPGKPKGRNRGANLRNVNESDTENGSDLSFDIDDTILTVESHDTEKPHSAGDILTSGEAFSLRQQLNYLQTRYHDLQTRVEPDRHKGQGHGKGHTQGPGPPPIGRQRRWSIGSSDTSSFRQETRYKPGKHLHHKHHSREFKNISKRFQRLESHVVTLARSVAHLSSELRTHNAMVNELDIVKKELRELRDNPSRPWPPILGSDLDENERFRGWVPSLTNPKRVNKLTKFFGTEPPLLEIFLKKLGYEQYAKNFQSEHIGMIELPYMTEDRLEKIGVPMGPRSRILKEAQLCFKQENYNIYLV